MPGVPEAFGSVVGKKSLQRLYSGYVGSVRLALSGGAIEAGGDVFDVVGDARFTFFCDALYGPCSPWNAVAKVDVYVVNTRLRAVLAVARAMLQFSGKESGNMLTTVVGGLDEWVAEAYRGILAERYLHEALARASNIVEMGFEPATQPVSYVHVGNVRIITNYWYGSSINVKLSEHRDGFLFEVVARRDSLRPDLLKELVERHFSGYAPNVLRDDMPDWVRYIAWLRPPRQASVAVLGALEDFMRALKLTLEGRRAGKSANASEA